jgi:hypothetical protein
MAHEGYGPQMIRCLLVLGLLACGTTSRSSTATATATATALQPPRRSFTVRPGELGEPGVLERIPHRARLSRFGRAFTDPAGEPLVGDGDADREVVPVIGESANQILVVSDQDDARVSLWIDRPQLAVAASVIRMASR